LESSWRPKRDTCRDQSDTSPWPTAQLGACFAVPSFALADKHTPTHNDNDSHTRSSSRPHVKRRATRSHTVSASRCGSTCHQPTKGATLIPFTTRPVTWPEVQCARNNGRQSSCCRSVNGKLRVRVRSDGASVPTTRHSPIQRGTLPTPLHTTRAGRPRTRSAGRDTAGHHTSFGVTAQKWRHKSDSSSNLSFDFRTCDARTRFGCPKPFECARAPTMPSGKKKWVNKRDPNTHTFSLVHR
jgi:hypothetical protein